MCSDGDSTSHGHGHDGGSNYIMDPSEIPIAHHDGERDPTAYGDGGPNIGYGHGKGGGCHNTDTTRISIAHHDSEVDVTGPIRSIPTANHGTAKDNFRN